MSGERVGFRCASCRRVLPLSAFLYNRISKSWCDECYDRQTAGLCACKDPLCSGSYR
jgi:hypothetical protein